MNLTVLDHQSKIDYQRKEEEHSSEDDEEIEEIQARKVRRPVGSKNKIYEKSQRELRDRSKLNAPKKYDEHCFLIKLEPIDYTEAVKSEDSRY